MNTMADDSSSKKRTRSDHDGDEDSTEAEAHALETLMNRGTFPKDGLCPGTRIICLLPREALPACNFGGM